MRLSITLTNHSWSTPLRTALLDAGRAADDAGIDTIWIGDHLLQMTPGVEPDSEMLESHATLSFLAAATERVRLGTMVAGVTFRPPALLVKTISTLDVLSGGRAWLGIGTGYQQEEADAMGLPLPPISDRYDYLEDTLELALQMWRGDSSPFQGRKIRADRPLDNPAPLTRPHPPILIGGTGERRTLPLVARYADACNVFDIPDGGATISRKLDVLRSACDAIGRAYDQITVSVSTWYDPDESPTALAQRCKGFERFGIGQVVLLCREPWTPEPIASVGAAAALLAEGSA